VPGKKSHYEVGDLSIDVKAKTVLMFMHTIPQSRDLIRV
jgi:hypothetical protein